MPELPQDIMMEGTPEPGKKHGFFSKDEVIPKQGTMRNDEPIGPDVTELYSRLRITEERYANLRNKTGVLEQNMISRHKQLQAELKATGSDIREMKMELSELKERIMHMAREFQAAAKKEDLKVLEKYIQLWEPIRFVSRNEVEDIVKSTIERMK